MNSSVKSKLAWGISTVGGAGFSPIAPGTAGSLVAAILFFGLGRFSILIQLAAILLMLAISLWAAKTMESETHLHDDGRIVIDELLGMWVTLLGFPPTWQWILVGFFLFRLLDIVKPYPANYIDQKWPGARGVIFDDIVSGIYAQACLRAGLRLISLL